MSKLKIISFASFILFPTVSVRSSKPGPPNTDGDALQLLRIIWKDIAKKPKKEIDDIIRGMLDAVKKDERPPYNRKEQKLHPLKLISENIAKISAENKKSTAGTSASLTREPSMGNAKKKKNIFFSYTICCYGNGQYYIYS
ncbi:hypothetical protein Hanom_Chr15g01394711 [Helianthus anomalus]